MHLADVYCLGGVSVAFPALLLGVPEVRVIDTGRVPSPMETLYLRWHDWIVSVLEALQKSQDRVDAHVENASGREALGIITPLFQLVHFVPKPFDDLLFRVVR